MGAESRVTIQMAGSEQLSAAADFVRADYQKSFGTSPKSVWPDCLVAFAGERIVGTIALQFSEGARFEIENLFLLDFSVLVHPRTQFASYGRFIAHQPTVGKALAFAGFKYGLSKGRKYAISCAKPNLLRYLQRSYKMEMQILDCAVNNAAIPEEDRPFFCQEPFPSVYVGDLERWYNVLKPDINPDIVIKV